MARAALSVTLLVAILGLFTSQGLADFCLGLPFKTKNTICGGDSDLPSLCGVDEYCDLTATCVPKLADGSVCLSGVQCASGLCNGPTAGGMICVASSGPGQPCTGDGSVAKADCSPLYFCNTTSLVCNGGYYGDGCTNGVECRSGRCTGGVCDGSAGLPCSSDSVCSPDNYCQSSLLGCVPRLPIGSQCLSSSTCALGAQCLAASFDAETRSCVGDGTLASGAYCDGSSVSCQSGICDQNYCRSKPPAYCTSPTECADGTICTCDKDYLLTGYGKCTSFPCSDQLQAFMDCLPTCSSPNTIGFAVSNTCLSLKCKSQYDALNKCNNRLINFLFKI